MDIRETEPLRPLSVIKKPPSHDRVGGLRILYTVEEMAKKNSATGTNVSSGRCRLPTTALHIRDMEGYIHTPYTLASSRHKPLAVSRRARSQAGLVFALPVGPVLPQQVLAVLLDTGLVFGLRTLRGLPEKLMRKVLRTWIS
jgi:hypothetical protein